MNAVYVHTVGAVSDKDFKLKSKQLSMLARAIENNPSEFPKDTLRQVNLLRSFIISILVLSNGL